MDKNTLHKVVYIVLDTVLLICLFLIMFALKLPMELKNPVCHTVNITISDNVTDNFLSAGDIKAMLKARNLYPLGKSLNDINTRTVEAYLHANSLIHNAECYHTVSGAINIDIKQRTAVMRVKSDTGEDYYLDECGEAIFRNQYPADLIIATGNINKIYARRYLMKIGNYIVHDSFWKNQIEQIHVLPNNDIEMIPRVGEHVIFLGQPKGIEKKLDRLRKFYLYALNDIGWNKYSMISVDIPNQIVCKKK